MKKFARAICALVAATCCCWVALISNNAAQAQSPAGAPAKAPELHFTHEGLEINAGSLGKFTFEFPALLDESQKTARKLVERVITPKIATLRYEGPLEATISIGEGGALTTRFADAPPEVKFVEWKMQIPISFNQGGSWKLAEKQDAFPKEKPAKPHLYQGHAETLHLTNFENRVLLLKVPQYSFLQLTDNREWNWAIFHFKAVTPFAADRKELTLAINLQEPTTKAGPLVDELGQSTREEWPGKVKDPTELRNDVEAEKAYYGGLQPPALGTYGGLPGSKTRLGLKETGFFHVEKKGDRWLLVDPAGEAFFHLGLCTVNPGEDYTLVKGRESAFAWIPPQEREFGTTYRANSPGVTSFHLANVIRKYGQPYDPETYTARMIERMKKWGFNSIGAFSSGGEKARTAARFPSVAHLPLSEWDGIPRIQGIEQVWDPYDEATRKKIEENFSRALPPRATDPLIIGYFIANEPIYENIPHLIPALKGSQHACKRKLVKGLEAKYKTAAAFNAAWGLSAKGFADLEEMVVPVETASAKADIQEFTGEFLEEMFRLVSESFRRHDPNHLLLGSRLMPGTIQNEKLCRIMGRHVDLMSFNYYTNGVDLALLRRIHDWTGKPLILSEFYWSASKASGLAGGREVASMQERGFAYRNYVEQSAASGIVVGIEWFTLIDQAVTGRWFQGFDGERANTGVLSVTDRPWKETLAEMMKTNYGIYKVWLGEQPPFEWSDARFRNTR